MVNFDAIGLYAKYFLIYVGWWLIPLLGLFMMKRSLSKYPVNVIIYEKRGENIVQTNDVAGRFDKPVTAYRLKKNKDSIPIPNYDWILQCMNRPTNFFERIASMLAGKIGSITLFKYGSKQYKPVRVTLNNGRVVQKFKEIKDKNGEPVFITVYEPLNVKDSMNKLDFDVIDWDDMNHMTQELRAIALRRSPVKDFLERYGGIIGIVVGFLCLVIGGYYFKEMMIDAGNKLYSAGQQGANNIGANPNPQPIAEAPTGGGIPFIPGL